MSCDWTVTSEALSPDLQEQYTNTLLLIHMSWPVHSVHTRASVREHGIESKAWSLLHTVHIMSVVSTELLNGTF